MALRAMITLIQLSSLLFLPAAAFYRGRYRKLLKTHFAMQNEAGRLMSEGIMKDRQMEEARVAASAKIAEATRMIDFSLESQIDAKIQSMLGTPATPRTVALGAHLVSARAILSEARRGDDAR